MNKHPDSGNLVPGVAHNMTDLVTTQPGAIVSRTLTQTPVGTLTLFAFAEGQALSEHSAPFDAFVQVLAGRAEITIGGEVVSAKAGDLVVMPADIPHAVNAATDMKMLLTMFRTQQPA
ncbi:cupin superfamily barrel domain protein [Syntrophotalea carbinolica DSM 2380]|uniref:Cupin superfamily barrel domain protein n=1 Tax=Syntrophotalea carbinolica (strain DSM 2380 / NBRC 103641 / GraBd1) TaxID=338963 RepID=Q3A5W2_SYNC1|nr:cupin domain-containing protein [Syntrophotalea carbinolica]ABA88245.1 cupin superfamily barrel domain protein [Syntrophotalea carbinolica DSM 2380]